MCGFFGIIFKKESNTNKTEESLAYARPILEARGPDSWSQIFLPNGGIAAARLEIRGGQEGAQPIQTSENQWLCYNGEIYNFHSINSSWSDETSDTYHLAQFLKQKGDIARLDGMFAFSLTTKDNITLIRDRFGIKPLYYVNNHELFAWSSDARALFPLIEKKIDCLAISKYLAFNYIPGESHLYTEIKKVIPGHQLTYNIDEKTFTSIQYADIHSGSGSNLKEAMENSIKDQTRLGKREHGIYFSGGMDSSNLALCSQSLSPELFHVHFTEEDYSELDKAQDVSTHLGLKLFKTAFTHKDFIHSFADFCKSLPAPLADPGHYPLWHLNKWIKKNKKSKYMLSGDGADEIFCGYQTFTATWIHEKITNLPMPIRNFLSQISLPLNNINDTKIGIDYKTNKFLSGINVSNEYAHFFWRNVFHPEQISLLTGDEISFNSVFEEFIQAFEKGNDYFKEDKINALMYADMKTWLADNNLYKVDHASSSFGLEARVPYLSNGLVSKCFTIPGKEKFKLINNKPHLRNYLKIKMPRKLLKNKSPFHPPYQQWFKNELNTFARDSLMDGLLSSKIFDERNFKSSVVRLFENENCNPFKIYNLLVLEYWLREHY